MSGFKRRTISPEQVAAVEAVTAEVPLVGDPRMQVAPVPSALPAAPAVIPLRAASLEAAATVAEFEVGRVFDVPLKRIRSNPMNPRAIYTASAVDEMATSLASHGQRVSCTAYVDDDGDLVLIEGETRRRGATAAGLATLRLEVRPRPESDRALYEEARAANVERRDQTPLDDAFKWKELLAKKVYPTQAALGKALGLREEHVSRVLSLADLPRRITDAMSDEPELLTLKMLNALREYWAVKGDDATLELILEVARNGLGAREVTARRKAAERGPTKRPRSVCEAVQFRGAKGELKSFEEDGRIELTLKGLTLETAEELSAKLRTLLSA